MFYKVKKGNKTIDVLENLVYLKYQPKHNRMIFCKESEAQAIFSSDRTKIWHEASLYSIPVSGYETVEIEEIDEYEYKQRKMLNGRTPEEIIDAFMLSLIEEGVVWHETFCWITKKTIQRSKNRWK